MNGKFIVIEGLEGAGKTSAITEVAEVLYKHGIYDVKLIREPGSTPLAEELRKLIKNNMGAETITDYAELLMIYAARAQLVERVIKPALAHCTWVVSDRHDLSSQAYQGGGRGVNMCFLQTLRNTVLGELRPDLTIYLDISPNLGLARTHACRELDRIEAESLEFFERTRMRYQTIAAMDDSIITIDASQPLAEVHVAIRNKMTQWLANE